VAAPVGVVSDGEDLSPAGPLATLFLLAFAPVPVSLSLMVGPMTKMSALLQVSLSALLAVVFVILFGP
jgi:hypothetical protein